MRSTPGLGSAGCPASIDAGLVDALGDKTETEKSENAAPAEASAPVVQSQAEAAAPAEDDSALVTGAKASGTVKIWKAEKNYGFIGPDDTSKDVFAHSSAITQEGVNALVEGEKVQFTVSVEADGRLKATEVTGPDGGPLKGKWEEGDDVKTGVVARWRGDKGFGFITPDEGAEGEKKDVFVHVNDCGVNLTEGAKVEYTKETSEDGRDRAAKVYGVGGRPIAEPLAPQQPVGGAMRMGMQPIQPMMMTRPMVISGGGVIPYGMMQQSYAGMGAYGGVGGYGGVQQGYVQRNARMYSPY